MADVFSRLGVRRLINAHEVISSLGGTRVRPEAARAMEEAREHFVYLPDLIAAAGARLAKLTKNEAATVVGCAQAGLVLGVAACIDAKDDVSVRCQCCGNRHDLPQVLVHRSGYNPYVRNLSQAGAEIVEYGYPTMPATADDLEEAITPNTVCVLHMVGRLADEYAPPVEQVVEVAHARGAYVIADAAAHVPPTENLWRFTRLGVDLVVVSGGKGIRGPQDSGLVVGVPDIIRRVERLNSPNHRLGRSMKSCKEDIVGLVHAVEAFVREDDGARYDELMMRAEAMRSSLGALQGISMFVDTHGRRGQRHPRLVIELTSDSRLSSDEVISSLLDSDPAIAVGRYENLHDAIYVNPMSLDEDEERLVVDAISALLG